MFDVGFGYVAVLAFDMSGRVTSMIADLPTSEGPLQAVIWNVQLNAWSYDPSAAARFLFDDRYFNRTRRIDRPTAEQVAREILHTELPSEEVLREICAEGLRTSEEQRKPDDHS